MLYFLIPPPPKNVIFYYRNGRLTKEPTKNIRDDVGGKSSYLFSYGEKDGKFVGKKRLF